MAHWQELIAAQMRHTPSKQLKVQHKYLDYQLDGTTKARRNLVHQLDVLYLSKLSELAWAVRYDQIMSRLEDLNDEEDELLLKMGAIESVLAERRAYWNALHPPKGNAYTLESRAHIA